MVESIGGYGAVTDNLKAECLTYLQHCAVMASQVVKAELPSHDNHANNVHFQYVGSTFSSCNG